MNLALVLPTFNEVGNLERCIAALHALTLPDVRLRILIVDDASTDGTAALADAIARRAPDTIEVLHRDRKRGLGSAYVEGFARVLDTGVDLVGQMDADLSHEPSVLIGMIAAIRDADVVIGSRYVAGGGVDAEWAWHRTLLSWTANRVVVPAVLALPVTDATSGYRLWRSDALARIARTAKVCSSGYGFQVEMVYLAHRVGCRIREVPIYFRERRSGESKMTMSVALSAVREIWSMRRTHRGTRALHPPAPDPEA